MKLNANATHVKVPLAALRVTCRNPDSNGVYIVRGIRLKNDCSRILWDSMGHY